MKEEDYITMVYEKMVIRGRVPSKSNCYRVVTVCGHGSLAKQEVLRDYERSFLLQCPLRDRDITGFFKLTADVYHVSNRPDLDNAFKIILDCLQSCGAIRNDRQCIEIHARKLIDKADPRVELVLEEVEL